MRGPDVSCSNVKDYVRIVVLGVILLRTEGGVLAPSFLILERYRSLHAV